MDEDDEDDLLSEVRDVNRQKQRIAEPRPAATINNEVDHDEIVVVSGLSSDIRKASKENAIGEAVCAVLRTSPPADDVSLLVLSAAKLTRKREKFKTPGDEPESSSMAAARSNRRRELGSQHDYQENMSPSKRKPPTATYVLSSPPSGAARAEDQSSVYDVDEDMDLAQEIFGDQSGSPQSKFTGGEGGGAIDLTGDDDDDPIETGGAMVNMMASQQRDDFRDKIGEPQSEEDYDDAFPFDDVDFMVEAAEQHASVSMQVDASSPYHTGGGDDTIVHPIVKLSDMRADFRDFYTNHWRRSEASAQARDDREGLGNGRASSTSTSNGGSGVGRGGGGRGRSRSGGWRGGGFAKSGARRGGGRGRGRS